MITRRPFGRFVQLPVILAAAFGLLTVSCEKVPLLAPSSASITLTASATALPINGTTDLIAQVLEQAGTPPHSGTHVIFTTTLGSVQPSEAETDLNGRVVVKFLAGTASGTATIVASSGGAGSSGATTGTGATATTTDSRTVKIAIGAAAVGSIAISAIPNPIPASGGRSTIVAKVADSSGNSLANVPVSFTTDAGSLSLSVVNTDQSGNAQTTLTTNKTAKVTATAGVSTTSGTTTTSPSATVTVGVNVGPSVTISGPTPASPTVGQPVSFTITVQAPGATQSPIRDIAVDWGDGQRGSAGTGTTSTVQHIYRAPGLYTVTVVVTDTNGDTGSAQTSVSVGQAASPTVSIATDASIKANTPAKFTVTGTIPTGAPPNTAIRNMTINFGDGSPTLDLGNSSPVSVQHSYLVPKEYQVTATITDTNGGAGQTTTNIVVIP